MKDYNNQSINNSTNQFSTILCDTIKGASEYNSQLCNELQSLLSIGANPDGISNTGIGLQIPLTTLDFRYPNWKSIVELLILNKADVNGFDVFGNTLLTKYCEYYVNSNKTCDYDILWLLSRGCNVNGTIFKNPLYILSSKLKFPEFSILYNLFLFWGLDKNSNIYSSDYSTRNNKKNVLIKINLHTHLLSKYPQLNTNWRIVNSQYLSIVHKIYKLREFDYTTTINKITQLKSGEYNETEVIEIRKAKYNFNSLNSETLAGYDIYCFNLCELFWDKPSNCVFHHSEIPDILRMDKNPYTNQQLSTELKLQLIKLDYIPIYTLEELLSKDDPQPTQISKSSEITKDELLFDFLKTLVNSFNCYIQTDELRTLKLKFICELQNLMYMGNVAEINSNINMNDRLYDNSKSCESNINQQFNKTLMYLILEIQKGKLPLISNVIDQLLNDKRCCDEILKLFPKHYYYNIGKLLTLTGEFNKLIYLLESSNLGGEEWLNSTQINLVEILNNRSKDNYEKTWQDITETLYISILDTN